MQQLIVPTAAPDTWWMQSGTYSMRLYTPSYWKVLDATGNRACNWQTFRQAIPWGLVTETSEQTISYTIGCGASGPYNGRTTPDMRRAPNNWIEMGP